MKRVSLKCMLATLCLASLAGAADLQINIQTTADQKDPDLAVNNAGQCVVAWNSYGQDSNSGGIFARRMDRLDPRHIGKSCRPHDDRRCHLQDLHGS